MNILTPLKAVLVPDSTSTASQKSFKPRKLNRFASLDCDIDEVEEAEQSGEATLTQNVPGVVVSPSTDLVLDDDELAQWIELSLFIYVSLGVMPRNSYH